MQEIIFVVCESPEGGFEAQALGYSIFTEADTLKELRRQVQDAVQCHFPDESRPKAFAFTLCARRFCSREAPTRHKW